MLQVIKCNLACTVECQKSKFQTFPAALVISLHDIFFSLSLPYVSHYIIRTINELKMPAIRYRHGDVL